MARDYRAMWLTLKAAIREEVSNQKEHLARGTKEEFDRNKGILHGVEAIIQHMLEIEEADDLPAEFMEGVDDGPSNTGD